MSTKKYIKFTLKRPLRVTRLITVLSYELSSKYRNEGERHDFWELVYVDRGSLFYRAEQERGTLHNGEIILHAPGEFHSVECDGAEGTSVFIITFDCTAPALKILQSRPIKISGSIQRIMSALIQECFCAFKVSKYPITPNPEAPYGAEQLVRSYLEEFLIRLIRKEQTAENLAELSYGINDTTLTDRIKGYLSDKTGSRVTLDEIAQALHFSKSRLCDAFKRSEGTTILGYHTQLKIAEAKRMLFETKLTVAEISESLDFISPEYFSRVFKKHTGNTPTSFRRKLIIGNTVFLEKESPIV